MEIGNIVIAHLPDGPDNPTGKEYYVRTYEEEALTEQPPWGESFAVGDIQPGWYRISYPHFGLRRHLVQVLPGQLTVVTIQESD